MVFKADRRRRRTQRNRTKCCFWRKEVTVGNAAIQTSLSSFQLYKTVVYYFG